MSRYNHVSVSGFGTMDIDTVAADASFKKLFGKVHTSTESEWYGEYLTCSHKVSPRMLMTSSLPGTPPTLVGQATAYAMLIQTGSNSAADLPAAGGGRVYCVKDAADTTGRTWVTVLTGAINYLSSQNRYFNSTGSDKDFVINDWVAPWHVTGSALNAAAYQPRVYAITQVGDPPASIIEISASNFVSWMFYPEAGVLKFADPHYTFSFSGFNTFEENLASLSSYTDSGYTVESETKTTTDHTIVLAGAWTSGSTSVHVADIVSANTGALTSSCFAVEGYRYRGGYGNYSNT